MYPSMEFSGKVIWITRSSSGIGEALAVQLAARGAKLVLSARNKAGLERVAGKVGAPLRTGYCAAKHAVMGFFDALHTEVAADGVQVTTIVPGFIRTNVSKNALTAEGKATGEMNDNIDGGMEVGACAAAIIDGFAAGNPEIAVGEGPEMQLLQLKRDDPIATFQMLEAMTAQVRARSH